MQDLEIYNIFKELDADLMGLERDIPNLRGSKSGWWVLDLTGVACPATKGVARAILDAVALGIYAKRPKDSYVEIKDGVVTLGWRDYFEGDGPTIREAVALELKEEKEKEK